MGPELERSRPEYDILSRVPAPLPGRALRHMRIRSGSGVRKPNLNTELSEGTWDTTATKPPPLQQPVICDWILGPYMLVEDDPVTAEAQPVFSLDNWEIQGSAPTDSFVNAVVGSRILRPKSHGDPSGRIVLNVHNVLITPPRTGDLHAQQQATRTTRDYTVSADVLNAFYDKSHVPPPSIVARNEYLFPLEKPVIIAATLRHLVTAMTSWTSEDDTSLLVDVLLTFRSYISGTRLFELMQLRFEWAARELVNVPNSALAANVLQNTYTALRYWVEHYYHTDFVGTLSIRLGRWVAATPEESNQPAFMTAQQYITELQGIARNAAELPPIPVTAATVPLSTFQHSLQHSRSFSSPKRSTLGSFRRQKEDAPQDESGESPSPSRTLRLRKSLRRMRRIASGSYDGGAYKSDINSSPGSPRRILSRSKKDTSDASGVLTQAEHSDVSQMEAALVQLEERIVDDIRREQMLYPAAPRKHAAATPVMPSSRNSLFFSLRSDYVARLLDSLEAEFLRSTSWLDVTETPWDQPHARLGSWEPMYRSFISRSIGALTGQVPAPQGGALVLIARFNVACTWIATHVILTESLPERARLVSKWIMVAWHCYCHNNIASLCQIMFALQLPAVARLSQTWDELTEGETRVFDDLRHFVSPLENFKHLRAHMHAHLSAARSAGVGTPYIPFFGIFVADLASNDALASYTDATLLPSMMPLYDDLDLSQSWDALINVFRMRNKAAIIRDVISCQQLVPAISADSSAPFYAEAWQLDCLPEVELNRCVIADSLSEQIEPKGSLDTRTAVPVVIGSDAILHSQSFAS